MLDKNNPKIDSEIKQKAYQFLDEQEQKLSKIIKRHKTCCSDCGAHFSVGLMHQNIEKGKSDHPITNFFDNISPLYLRLRFLIIADIMHMLCHSTLESFARNSIKENADSEIKKFQDRYTNLYAKYQRDKKAIGRNDPCPFGSGLKYKKCCPT